MSENTCSGAHFVAGRRAAGRGTVFHAANASTGARMEPSFFDAGASQVDEACEAAAATADAMAATDRATRAAFLRRIAAEIERLGDELLVRAFEETALPMARLQNERARTMFQCETFAKAVEDGSWVDARIDHADAQRKPMPKPDLRAMLVPIGPVAVFGASNFPFAYSVAGGDTTSAFAAGCPVVVKAHPMHPGTSELAARAITAAIKAIGMPDGVFSMVHGVSHEVGRHLVEHPAIEAVGFTGSHAGGSALFRLAAQRARPIPVFAEMGSVNPVFVLPDAMAQRGENVAKVMASSALLGCGQFCTSPGMVAYIDGPDARAFEATFAAAMSASSAGTLVHAGIRSAFEVAVREVLESGGVRVLAEAGGAPACQATGARPRAFVTEASSVLAASRLREEVYGPACLLVRCRDAAELLQLAASMPGHLTATVHGSRVDLAAHAQLLRALQRRVGRIVHDGVPTGVEVCSSMQHGGPWPASSDSRFTAVGPRAMLRFARSVAWQDAPQATLPSELRDGNPLGIWRTVDGKLVRE